MDLGITGRKAIVCAASKGLGRACAFSLARNGVDVVILARTAGPLEETALKLKITVDGKVYEVEVEASEPETHHPPYVPAPTHVRVPAPAQRGVLDSAWSLKSGA